MSQNQSGAIAVIGLACRYPGAEDPVELWENVLARRQQFRRLPDVRLPLSDYWDADPSAPDKTYGRRAALIDGFEFDPVAHRIPRSAFESSDIVHWLTLDTALRAVASAGLDLAALDRDRIGMILGNSLTGEESRTASMRLRWPFVRRVLQRAAAAQGLGGARLARLERAAETLFKSVFPPITEDSLAGGLSNTIAGRVCNVLDVHGGGYTVDGACSSSLLAVATAADYLQSGRMDIALAGGVDVSLDTFELVGFAKATALAVDEMRVYDRRGSGFIPGEGCGVVVLQRLDQARAQGRRVLAVLRGWGVSSDGRGGITAPSARGQALALGRAYARAGYAPSSLDFVEGHGTGTRVGDRVELAGIALAFGADSVTDAPAVAMTSLKSIVGHTKAAAGIGGLIKAVLAVNQRVIPPTAGCHEPNPAFGEEARMLYPATRGARLAADACVRAGVSAMGFGGINCHVTLESGDAPAADLEPSCAVETLLASWREAEVFPLAGDSPEALRRVLAELRARADGMAVAELGDLAAELAAAVQGDSHRLALVAGTPDELLQRIDAALDCLALPDAGEGASQRAAGVWIGSGTLPSRLGFVFPGQGSQRVGMGAELLARYAWARERLDQADAWLRDEPAFADESLSMQLSRPIERDPTGSRQAAWMAALTRTEVAQPAICLVSALWLERLRQLGLAPAAVAGHSLGELTALHAARRIDLKTLIRLAAARGAAMATPGERAGAMAYVAASASEVESLLRAVPGYCVVANLNAPDQTVVSGDAAAVDEVLRLAGQHGFDARRLAVSNAFHSALVASAAERLRTFAIVPTEPDAAIRVVSSVDGCALAEAVDLAGHLAGQIVRPVQFQAAVAQLAEHCDWLIEVGPGRVLSGLVRQNGGPPCRSVEGQGAGDLELCGLLAEAWARGHAIRWAALHEGRFLRPFVPAAARRFWVAPCERPLPDLPSAPLRWVDDEIGQEDAIDAGERETPHSPDPSALGPTDVADTRGRVFALVAEATGFPPDSLADHHRLLDDLNLDSIKAAALLARASQSLGSSAATADLGNARLGDIVARLDATRDGASEAALMQTLVAELAKATGFPPSAFAPDQRLLDDLNLDSIKAGALLARLAKSVGLPAAPAGLANAAIETIVASFLSAREAAAPSTDAPWVRDFVQHWVPAPWPASDPPPPDRVALDGEPDGALARALAGSLRVDPEAPVRVLFVPAGSVEDRVATLAAAAALGADSARRIGRLLLVTAGGFDGVDAFALSLAQEWPAVRVGAVDLPVGLTPAAAAAVVVRELGHCIGVHRHTREGVREAPALRPTGAGEDSEPASGRPGDVVLVTGGGKGITAECAIALAQRDDMRLALIGRSARPAPEDASELGRTLARLRDAGVTHAYYACDVTDPRALADTVAAVRRDLGPVVGVIHGAGINIPRDAQAVTAPEALAEIAPKLLGFEALCSALESQRPRWIVALTSVIGLQGMGRNAWYAFANAALAERVRRLRHAWPETRSLALAYSIWAEVGMGVRLGSVGHLATRGIDAIPPQDGVAHFLQWAGASAAVPEVLVASRLGISEAPLALRGRFLGSRVRYTPGVELVSEVRLHPESDPWLRDHDFRGSLLFPTVFGLEAMAQAVLAVLGRTRFGGLAIEAIQLTRPIVVDPVQGEPIRIRVLAAAPTAAGSPDVVDAEIATGSSGFREAHFSARFRLTDEPVPDLPAPPPMPALDIDPTEDLYGRQLFQGPRFQRVRSLQALDDQGAQYEIDVGAAQDEDASDWVLGDPYARDALLQVLQVVVAPEVALPVAIDRLLLRGPSPSRVGVRRVSCRLEGRDGSTLVGAVDAWQDGTCVERLEGYRVRVIDRRPDWPHATTVRHPDMIDTALLQGELDRRAGALGLRAPRVRLMHRRGLHALPRAQRHALAEPLLAAAASDLLDGASRIDWHEAGPPTLVADRADATGIGLALSHDDGLLLATVGPGPQGCDLVLPAQYARDTWVRMLGTRATAAFAQIEARMGTSAAGLRLWAAREAAAKTLQEAEPSIDVVGWDETGGLHLRAGGGDGIDVLVFPLRLSRGPERVVAITAWPLDQETVGVRESAGPALSEAAAEAWDGPPVSGGIQDSGPGRTRRVHLRQPIGLREASNPSGTLRPSWFVDQMGSLRDVAMLPVIERWREDFLSGRWAAVTNEFDLRIDAPVAAGERVDAEAWLQAREQAGATSLIAHRWTSGTGSHRRDVARGHLRTTWVRVLARGRSEPAPPPGYLDALLATYAAPAGAPAPLDSLDDGTAGVAPLTASGSPALLVRTIETGLGDSDLVGNLAFQAYAGWQCDLLDAFLQARVPHAYRQRLGEFRVQRLALRYLREGLPFDRIEARLHAGGGGAATSSFAVDFLRDGLKLAAGRIEGVWTARGADGVWREAALPEA